MRSIGGALLDWTRHAGGRLRSHAGPVAATTISAVAGLVALSVLGAWIGGREALAEPWPLAGMNANAAAWLLAEVLALCLMRSGGSRTVAGALLVALSMFVAVAGLLEHVLGAWPVLDHLLLRSSASSLPIAGSSAVVLVLLGGAVLFVPAREGRLSRVAPLLASSGGLLAFAVGVGYATGVDGTGMTGGLTQISLPMAFGFLALAGAVFVARPERGVVRLLFAPTAGGRVLRRLLPAMLLAPILLGALRALGRSAGIYDQDTGTWLYAFSLLALLVPLTWSVAISLDWADAQVERAGAARLDAQRERAAFDRARIGSAIVSLEGRYQRVNDALCAMLGYSSEELLARSVIEVTHPDDRARDREALGAFCDGRRSDHHVQKRYLRRDGEVVHALTDVTVLFDGAHRPTELFVQVQDITIRVHAAEEVEHAQLETLARLAAAAEYRDEDTAEHTMRVGELAAALATRLRLPADEVGVIRLAAPLHDVGKLGISDAILLKPGELSEQERERMREHTVLGSRLLAGGSFSLLRVAEQIALTHHECWDGSGYPRGLRHEEIPIAGRIVAVADVYDALTHARPYKPAWSQDDALEEIIRQRGRQFDPRVVDALLELFAETPPAGRRDRAPRPRRSVAVAAAHVLRFAISDD